MAAGGSVGISIDITDRAKGHSALEISIALAKLDSAQVLVGIPEANAGGGRKLDNVQLAFLHSNGSPVHHIPARPFIEPAIEQEADAIGGYFEQAFEYALDGDTSGMMKALDKAGQKGENAVKRYIGSAALAPNAPSTIARKGSSAPLIDTGMLKASVTHIVES